MPIPFREAKKDHFGNKTVLRFDLKVGRVAVWWSHKGREFQLEGPVNEKAHWLAVANLVWRILMVSVNWGAESSWRSVELLAVREVCRVGFVNTHVAYGVNFVLGLGRNRQPVEMVVEGRDAVRFLFSELGWIVLIKVVINQSHCFCLITQARSSKSTGYNYLRVLPSSHPSHHCLYLLLLFCLGKNKIKVTAHPTITWWCPACPSKPPFLSGCKQHGRERMGLCYPRAHSNKRVHHAVPAATYSSPWRFLILFHNAAQYCHHTVIQEGQCQKKLSCPSFTPTNSLSKSWFSNWILTLPANCAGFNSGWTNTITSPHIFQNSSHVSKYILKSDQQTRSEHSTENSHLTIDDDDDNEEEEEKEKEAEEKEIRWGGRWLSMNKKYKSLHMSDVQSELKAHTQCQVQS